jgi:hypothetical protein
LDGGFLLSGYRQFEYRRKATHKLRDLKLVMAIMTLRLSLDDGVTFV